MSRLTESLSELSDYRRSADEFALPSLQMPLQPNMPGLSSATPLRRGRTVISERSRAVGRRPSCAVIWSLARDFRWIRKHWRRRFTTPSAGQFSCRRFGEGRIGQQPDSTIGYPSRRHRGYRPSRDGSGRSRDRSTGCRRLERPPRHRPHCMRHSSWGRHPWRARARFRRARSAPRSRLPSESSWRGWSFVRPFSVGPRRKLDRSASASARGFPTTERSPSPGKAIWTLRREWNVRLGRSQHRDVVLS